MKFVFVFYGLDLYTEPEYKRAKGKDNFKVKGYNLQ